MPVDRSLALLLIAGSFLVARCGRAGEERAAAGNGGGVAASAEAAGPAPQDAATGGPPPTEADDLPETVYYDLTRFPWYARAEPLRLDGAAYQQRGRVMPAPASVMHRAGSYEGVDVYRADQGDDATVYVPVFEGFWLPFVRSEPADSG